MKNIGGASRDNLPSPVRKGLTDLPNIKGGGGTSPLGPPVPASLHHIHGYKSGSLFTISTFTRESIKRLLSAFTSF